MPRSCVAFAAVALALAFFASTAGAEAAIETSASESIMSVGDTLTYHVRVLAPEGSQVLPAERFDRLGDFHVLARRKIPPRILEGEGTVFTEELVLSVYSPGEHAIAPPAVAVVDSRGDTTVLAGDTLRINVASVLGEGEADMRDIKGLATTPGASPGPVTLVAVGLAAAALAVALAVYLRRVGTTDERPAAVPAAHVVALERLESLVGSGLLERGEFKEFYTELSEALRVYLGQRYLVPAPEMTTVELDRRMQYLGLPRTVRNETLEILIESDMVKFAKHRPGIDRAFAAARRAADLVRKTSRGSGESAPAPRPGGAERAEEAVAAPGSEARGAAGAAKDTGKP